MIYQIKKHYLFDINNKVVLFIAYVMKLDKLSLTFIRHHCNLTFQKICEIEKKY